MKISYKEFTLDGYKEFAVEADLSAVIKNEIKSFKDKIKNKIDYSKKQEYSFCFYDDRYYETKYIGSFCKIKTSLKEIEEKLINLSYNFIELHMMEIAGNYFNKITLDFIKLFDGKQIIETSKDVSYAGNYELSGYEGYDNINDFDFKFYLN